MLSAVKSGASAVKSSITNSFSKVQKRAETLDGVDKLVTSLGGTYLSEESKKRSELIGCELSDFELKATLGTGSFGRVRLVRHRKTDRVYALKMLSKSVVLRTKQVEHIMSEKQLLSKISFPFIINLYGSFQDSKYLYLALEYSIGGEFFTHLRRAGKFSNETSRFFSQQVITALEHLHGLDIIYRDLKPENLLLDAKGNLKVCFCQLLLLSLYHSPPARGSHRERSMASCASSCGAVCARLALIPYVCVRVLVRYATSGLQKCCRSALIPGPSAVPPSTSRQKSSSTRVMARLSTGLSPPSLSLPIARSFFPFSPSPLFHGLSLSRAHVRALSTLDLNRESQPQTLARWRWGCGNSRSLTSNP
jgi:hypothetical protein